MEKVQSKNITVVKSHRRANIAVIIVASLAALILVAVAVLCAVKVDPLDGLKKPEYYCLYAPDSSERAPDNSEVQSKLSVATEGMKFDVMSAILQWHWDYSYNFKRNDKGEKVEISAQQMRELKGSKTEFVLEYVYAPATVKADGVENAQSLTVDGETVYFDRVKVLIGDTEGKVGTISLYPYLYDRINNSSDIEGISQADYKVCGINVRAETYTAYAALKELANTLGLKLPDPEPEATPDEGENTDAATDGEAA